MLLLSQIADSWGGPDGYFNGEKVTYRYQDNKKRQHTPTLDAETFISRFLQHVLPKGFVKVRYYGFFSPRKRETLERVKELFGLCDSEEKSCSATGCGGDAEGRVMRCPKCGEPMVLVGDIKPKKHLLGWPLQWRPP